MRFVKSESDSIYFNLTSERYLVENFKEPVFMLWIAGPSLLIGKNQNTLAEINYDYVKEQGLDVNRRLSGGGTVYNDFGNMNFTFITENSGGNIEEQFIKFTKPVVSFLKSLGVDAEFTGRNDILINGSKCSGNAQYYHKNIVLHHGTMLFDVDMSVLGSALKTKEIKYKDKAVNSVRSRVSNIKPHLNDDISIQQFQDALFAYMHNEFPDSTMSTLADDENSAIQKMVDEKYGTWEWNFGKSPKFDYQNEAKFTGGVVECQLSVKKGLITNLEIYGDFFGTKNIDELKCLLVGVKHHEEDIKQVLKEIDIQDYLFNVSVNEFTQLLF